MVSRVLLLPVEWGARWEWVWGRWQPVCYLATLGVRPLVRELVARQAALRAAGWGPFLQREVGTAQDEAR
jgi:hypothetical protein